MLSNISPSPSRPHEAGSLACIIRRMSEIVVVDYDPDWPATFEMLRDRIWLHVSHAADRIEHVGSTSVPGLAAKPIIDMTIVAADEASLQQVIDALAAAGYEHKGDLGIAGREAFAQPADLPDHHLYACVEGALALRNHLAVRDQLRSDPTKAMAYGMLKKQLASKPKIDIDSYIAGKSALLQALLRQAGFDQHELDMIRGLNAND